MKLVIVDSSMIHAMGYDRKTRLLEVVFNTGQTYCYEASHSRNTKVCWRPNRRADMQDNILNVYSYYQLKRGRAMTGQELLELFSSRRTIDIRAAL